MSEYERCEFELKRADAYYDICVRDYFSTFGTYATATTIHVAAVTVLVSAEVSGAVLALLSAMGFIVCVQWHISTSNMRDQYRYFLKQVAALERDEVANGAIKSPLVDAWQEDAKRAIRGQNSGLRGGWRLRVIHTPLGLRAASFPAIYSAVFLAIGLTALGVPDVATVAMTLAMLVGGSIWVYYDLR